MPSAPRSLPIIGITANHLFIDSGSYKGHQRVAVVQDYIKAIIKAGAVPLVLPTAAPANIIHQHLAIIDGLILSGGNDIQAHLFGEEPHRLTDECCPERDHYEITLAQLAAKQRKPILGICRGLQLLNVAFGGTLYQDLSLFSPNVHQHTQKAPTYAASHSVDIIKGTMLHQVFGCDTVQTNSFHHQGIKALADGFVVNAKSKDGVIEGIEKMDESYMLGVQWHPEFMVEHHPSMLDLFHHFVKATHR